MKSSSTRRRARASRGAATIPAPAQATPIIMEILSRRKDTAGGPGAAVIMAILGPRKKRG